MRLTVVFFTFCIVAAFARPLPADEPPPEKVTKCWVYVGTYTGEKSKGIYLCELDLKTGALTDKGVVAEAVNPSFVAIHPNEKFLYAVSEVSDMNKKKTGAVAAYTIDPATGKLKEINRKESGGAGPCHLIVDKAGKNVLVANYGGGSVASLPIDHDGSLTDAASVMQHKGTSVDPKRQQAPHAHSVNLDADNRFAMVADLGLDKVMIYQFDPATGKLKENDPPSAAVPAGGGPRHFAFHPNGRFAYTNNEMTSSVTAFKYDAKKGELSEVQTISTLPKDFKENNSTAEIVVHQSGKFLYVSNRGHDSIAVFAIDPETGKLTAAGHQPTGGKTPRNFNIDPTGFWLLACNQNSDSIHVFRIDAKSGALTKTEHKVEIAAPVCVRFLVPAK